MKILFVNRLFGIFWGGGETFDYNLAKTLVSKGYNVTILTGKPLFKSAHNKISDIKVVYIKSPYLRGISYKIGNKIPKVSVLFMLVDLYFFSLLAYKWIRKNIDSFDVIQILNMPILAKWCVDKLRKPTVVRFPGPPSERWELSIYRKIKNKNLIRFFAGGDTVKYLANKNFKVEDIPQGIDFEKFYKVESSDIRNKFNIKKDDVLLISCGRLIEGKGFEFLIDGFKIASEKFKNLKLMIVGEGSLKDKLLKKVKALSLEDKVIFTGRIKYDDLPKYYSCADIFLLLSSYESFSNVILEAMCCELPVIATNVGFIPFLITNELNGFLINCGDVKVLEEKILYLSQNKEIRNNMGKLNRKKIMEKYNWNYSAEKVVKLYESILNRKRKVVFVIPNLGKGGAERVCATILNHLDRNKFEPICMFYDNMHTYQINKDIKTYTLNISGTHDYFSKIYRAIKRIIKINQIIKKENPDTVLSFINRVNLSVIICKILSNFNFRLIISERNTVSVQQKGFFGFLTRLFIRFFYNKADVVVAVSNGVKNDLIKNFNIREDKVKVIYNPVDIEKIQKLSEEEITECEWFNEDIPIIINVASLTEKKGQKYLLKAFKIVREKIKCRLVILGEGPLEKELRQLAENLDISNDVRFLGFQKNPFKFMAKSTVFVLSSLHEGFPNVLIEAMACGVPVVSTDCPSGPNEIIRDGINGFLVPVGNINCLGNKIFEVISNKEVAHRFVNNSYLKIKKFSLNFIIKEYEYLLLLN